MVAVITTPIHSDVRQMIIEKETDKAIRNPAFIFDADADFMEIEKIHPSRLIDQSSRTMIGPALHPIASIEKSKPTSCSLLGTMIGPAVHPIEKSYRTVSDLN